MTEQAKELLEESIDNIDCLLNSGDTFLDVECRQKLRQEMKRWEKAIQALEKTHGVRDLTMQVLNHYKILEDGKVPAWCNYHDLEEYLEYTEKNHSISTLKELIKDKKFLSWMNYYMKN